MSMLWPIPSTSSPNRSAYISWTVYSLYFKHLYPSDHNMASNANEDAGGNEGMERKSI